MQLLQTLLEYGKSCIICKTLHLASYSFMYFKTCPLLYLNCIILFDAPWISRTFEDLQECCRQSGWFYFFLFICKFLIIFCLFEPIKTNLSIMWKSSFLLNVILSSSYDCGWLIASSVLNPHIAQFPVWRDIFLCSVPLSAAETTWFPSGSHWGSISF